MKNIKKMKENKNINLKDNNYNVKKYNITKDKYGNVFAQEI